MNSQAKGIYGGADPRTLPAYAVWEASKYLQIPERTVRNWTFGFAYATKSTTRKAAPLIQAADTAAHLLSFVNLAELHVLDALRRVHQLRVQRIRPALNYLKGQLDSPHPLIEQAMFTDGVSVFVDRYGSLINASREGQLAIRAVVEAHLRRIEYDSNGFALRLFPFIRKRSIGRDAPLDEPRVVSIDPRVKFGRPVIAGTGIPTIEVAERFKAGDSFEDLAEDYGRTTAEIQEAIRCELEFDAA